MFFKNVVAWLVLWTTAGIRRGELYRTLVRHVVEDGAYCHLVARTGSITAGYITITTEGWRTVLVNTCRIACCISKTYMYIVLNCSDDMRKFIY